MKKNVLLILSGGMDSTVALHQFKDHLGLAVTFNYGSNHAEAEIAHAVQSCHALGIPHMIVNLKQAFEGFKSGLLEGAEAIPEGHYAAANMAATVVPFRNGIMLSIATGLAESNKLTKVMIASHAGDHTVYPDCRPSFNEAISDAMSEGTPTDNRVSLWAPFSGISKRQIAHVGQSLGVDWSTTYSCYKGGDFHCGRCSTCVERLEALEDLYDETVYLDTEFWKSVC